MRRNALEPVRDLEHPTRADDPVWRAWRRAASAPLLPPPGRPSLDGYPGPVPQVVLRLPMELRRAVHLAHWRRTSLAAVVRAALEHHLDEGIGGRASRPDPRPVRAAGRRPAPVALPLVPSGTVLDTCSDAELAQGCADAAAGVVAEED